MIQLRNARTKDGQEQPQYRTREPRIECGQIVYGPWSDWQPVPAVMVPELLVNVPDGEPCE